MLMSWSLLIILPGLLRPMFTGNQQATTAAKIFIDKFVTNYGYLERILTDQAKAFNGKLYEALCREAKIKKVRTTPYRPQTNGQCERFNRNINDNVRSLAI